MTVQPRSDYFELADYLGVLRRRWLTVLALAVAGTALAGAYYVVAPHVYAATVLVQVNALQNTANALGGRTSGPINMDNEAQLAQSATVAAIVKSKLNSPLSVTSLLKNVKVAVPPNTTFLQITCSADTADLAERCTNAFGRAYLYNRRATALALITSSIKSLDAQATRLETSIEQLKAKVGPHGLPHGSAVRGVAELQLTANQARLTTIEAKINSATPLEANLTAKNTAVGQIVTPAVKPSAPVSPTKKLVFPSGLAVGMLLGLVLAFFTDWRRPRIQTARDVRRGADLPTVFDLTGVKSGAHAVFAPPRSRTGQAYTELAQYVGALLGDGHHVLLVAEAAEGSDGSTVAANLAGALARTRGETVLICAIPGGVAIPRLIGGTDGRGLADLLAGTAALADVTRRTADVPLLRVITPGLDAAGGPHDMRHDKVQRVMRELRREVRYVVIDVPPPSLDADAFSVAEFADAAVVAVEAGTARPSELTDCVQRLERMRTAALAAVLLPPAGRSSARRRTPGDEIVDSADVYAPEPSAAHAYGSRSRQAPSRQRSQPYEPQPRLSSWDESAGSSQPAIRPASRRAAASPGSANGTSRHAAAGRHYETDDDESSARDNGPLSSAWTPRGVSEMWPLPQGTQADSRGFSRDGPLGGTDEEAGASDPLIGH
jgi:capsular polysaccharide biosynthesis protein